LLIKEKGEEKQMERRGTLVQTEGFYEFEVRGRIYSSLGLCFYCGDVKRLE